MAADLPASSAVRTPGASAPIALRARCRTACAVSRASRKDSEESDAELPSLHVGGFASFYGDAASPFDPLGERRAALGTAPETRFFFGRRFLASLPPAPSQRSEAGSRFACV